MRSAAWLKASHYQQLAKPPRPSFDLTFLIRFADLTYEMSWRQGPPGPNAGWREDVDRGTQLGCHVTRALPYCTPACANLSQHSSVNSQPSSERCALAKGLGNRPFSHRLIGLLLLTFLTLLSVSECVAATYYWVGSAGGNTSSAANWSTSFKQAIQEQSPRAPE